MVKENFNGIMVKYFKVNGNQEPKMDLVFGNLPKVTTIKEIGYLTDNMAKEFINIKTVLMKDNLKIS